MTPEVKKRIEQIRQGIVPEGYKKGKIGIVPIKWNEVPFSTLFTSTSEYTDDLKQYPLYSLTIEDGITAKTERYERSHLVKKENSYKVVRPNDYAYNPMNIRFGAVARHKGDIPVAVSGYYDIFTTVHESDLVFMDSFLTYGPMITYYNKVSTGSLVEKQRVHFSDFLEFSLALPPLEERKKIAEILSTQDKAIELQERKIEELKRFKKGCLERMFPREGQKVPEKRFPGFTGDWEQRKVSTIASDTRGGGTPATSNETYWSGNIPWIQSSDLSEGKLFGVEPRKYISRDGLNNSATQLVPENSIAVVTRVGVGKLAFMPFSYTTSQDFLSLCKLQTEPHFTVYALYQMLQGELQAVQGTSIKGMTKDDLLSKSIFAPKDEVEQQQLGSHFRNLDTLITLHQRKLEEMKKQKKALMQLLLTGIVKTKGEVR